MVDKRLFVVDRVPDNLLASLEARDVVLWLRNLPEGSPNHQALVAFMGLPWRLVVTEDVDSALISALEATASVEDPLTRKRGYVQIIDSDPSRIDLPQRSLPVYLLNGRQGGERLSDYESRLRRMTMLEALRRSGAREILAVSSRRRGPQRCSRRNPGACRPEGHGAHVPLTERPASLQVRWGF